MNLDVRTMYIAIGATCFIVAAGLFSLQVRRPWRDGALQWTLGWAVQGVFWLLLGLRGIIWNFVSIVVATTFLAASFSLLYAAVREFQGRQCNRGILFFPPAATFVFFWYFSAYVDRLSYRIIFFSILTILQITTIVWALFRDTSLRERRSARLTSFAFILFGLIYLIRLLEGLTLPSEYLSVLQVTAARNANLMVALGVVMLTSIGFALMMRDRAEERLQESEQRWETTLASIGDAVIATDLAGRITFMNSIAEALTGWEFNEASQKPVAEVFNIINEQTRQKVEDPVTKVLEKGSIVGLANHTILVRKDGTEVPVDDSGSPIRDQNGKTTGVVLVFRDITELKAAQAKLRETTRRFQTIVDEAPIAIYVKNSEGRFVFGNRKLEQYTGQPLERLLGMTDYDFAPKEDADRWRENDRKVLEGQRAEVEEIGTDRDGRPYVNISVKFPLPDELGTPVEVCGISTDITERKRAEEQLRLAEEKSRLLIQYAPSMVYEIDFHHPSFKSVNDAMCQFLGYTREELLAMNPFDLLDEEGKAVFRERISRKMAGEAVSDSVEYKSRTKDGRAVYGVLNMTFTYKDGKPEGAVVVAHDITERKQAERAVQEAREYAESIIATVREPLVVLDARLRVVSANRSFHQTFQVSREETNGRLIYELGNQQWNIPRLREFLETILPKNTIFSEFEVDHDFPRIGRRIMLLNGRRLYRETNRTEMILLAIEDITERKRAEEALRENESRRRIAKAVEAERQRLYNVLETLPVMICLLTPDYHVAFANRAFREKFGESGGRHCYEYCFGLTAPCDFCESYKVLETGKPHRWEVVAPDGMTVIDAYDFPFIDVDGSPLILEMDIDITAWRQAEEALRKAHDQIQFFASQSLTAQETERKRVAGELHDSIAAALSAMKFRIEKFAQDMKQGRGNPESLQDLGAKIMEINNEVRRIMADLRPSILDDLGIIAAIDWFCREYQKTYSHLPVQKQIGILEAEVPDSLKTPIFRITQEAMNNIAKHSQASLVNLSLRKEDNKIRLTIQDNGQGFDLDNVIKGMGLSTMRERAQLSGGSFDLESGSGKGTVIRASWPL